MTANELRIGNWVNCTGIDIDTEEEFSMDCEVVSIPNKLEADYMFDVDFPSEDNSSVEPIPLTDKWLVKFGFDVDNKMDEDRTLVYELNAKGFSIEFEHGNDCFLECIGVDILYVHQLQNLYFALTGEELKTV